MTAQQRAAHSKAPQSPVAAAPTAPSTPFASLHAPASSSPSTVFRPLAFLQESAGVDVRVDVASASFAATAAVLFCTVFLWLWRNRRRRIRAQRALEPPEDTPAYRQAVATQTALIAAKKEQGNRAYIDREYERAAQLFAEASAETLALAKFQMPVLQLNPLVHPRSAEEIFDMRKASFGSMKDPDWPHPLASSHAPPGVLGSVPSDDLANLPTPLLNNIAVYASNRAACLLALNRCEEALAQAEVACNAQSGWSKGFLRAGQALEGLGLLRRAEGAYARGTVTDASDTAVAQCLRNVRELQAEMQETRDQQKRAQLRSNQQAAALAASPSSSSSSLIRSPAEQERFDRLTAWLTANGATFPYLYLRGYEHDHRGVHTLCRLAAGKLLLQVPLKCIMSSDRARSSIVGKALEHMQVELSSNHSFLACFLLEERRRGDASFWKSYIDILPAHFENVPIFFQPAEKSLLKGSFTLQKIEERHIELQQEYETICKSLDLVDLDALSRDDSDSQSRPRAASKSPPPAPASTKFSERHSLNDFIWARTAVITRIFGFQMLVPNSAAKGGSTVYKTDGLVPMADMLNHSRPRESSWNFDDARQAFVITSLVPFAARQQVCDSYGRKCNSRFFVNYGFTLLDNESDNQAVVWIPLEAAKSAYASAALLERKRKLLGISLNEDPKVAAQILAQSASSLSSSSFQLSPTTPSAANWPPPQSLRFQIPFDQTDRITREIFSLLRLLVAIDFLPASPSAAAAGSITEMAAIDAHVSRSVGETEQAIRLLSPLSLRNELAVLDTLSVAAETALAQFDTTIEQDDKLLQLDDEARAAEQEREAAESASDSISSPLQPSPHRLTSNQRNCVIMRRGEKKVLQHYVQLNADAVALVSAHAEHLKASPASSVGSGLSPWDRFVKLVAHPRHGAGQGASDFYINETLLPLLKADTR